MASSRSSMPPATRKTKVIKCTSSTTILPVTNSANNGKRSAKDSSRCAIPSNANATPWNDSGKPAKNNWKKSSSTPPTSAAPSKASPAKTPSTSTSSKTAPMNCRNNPLTHHPRQRQRLLIKYLSIQIEQNDLILLKHER